MRHSRSPCLCIFISPEEVNRFAKNNMVDFIDDDAYNKRQKQTFDFVEV